MYCCVFFSFSPIVYTLDPRSSQQARQIVIKTYENNRFHELQASSSKVTWFFARSMNGQDVHWDNNFSWKGGALDISLHPMGNNGVADKRKFYIPSRVTDTCRGLRLGRTWTVIRRCIGCTKLRPDSLSIPWRPLMFKERWRRRRLQRNRFPRRAMLPVQCGNNDAVLLSSRCTHIIAVYFLLS